MPAVFTAFAEYLFQFVIYLAAAALAVFLGIKLRQSRDSRHQSKEEQ